MKNTTILLSISLLSVSFLFGCKHGGERLESSTKSPSSLTCEVDLNPVMTESKANKIFFLHFQNVRSAPSTRSGKIARTLPHGAPVNIVASISGDFVNQKELYGAQENLLKQNAVLCPLVTVDTRSCQSLSRSEEVKNVDAAWAKFLEGVPSSDQWYQVSIPGEPTADLVYYVFAPNLKCPGSFR